jgi:5-methylcytosine-specific restriction endonuclease McrA
MNIVEVIKFIREAEHQHFISVDKKVWKRWGLLVKLAIWSNKNYVPCKIYRKKYKFLENIVVVGLKWNGKNVKRRTSGFAKEFLQENKKAKCIYCGCKLNESNATTDHIIPISEGGNNSQVNLIVCCFDCNNERGNLNFYDYLKIKNPNNTTKYF